MPRPFAPLRSAALRALLVAGLAGCAAAPDMGPLPAPGPAPPLLARGALPEEAGGTPIPDPALAPEIAPPLTDAERAALASAAARLRARTAAPPP